MSDPETPATGADPYIHGHDSSVVQQHQRRTAEEAAAFLLPQLEPDMRLLDVGCGPGSITAGLGRHLPQGSVVGIEVVSDVLRSAQALIQEQAVENIELAEASVYGLPFVDDGFDAAYAHQVLQHLAHPVDALREMRRVVRPGGLVGVRDSDYGTMVSWPKSPSVIRFLELYHAVAEQAGGDADAGRRIPTWMREAGFDDVTITTSTWAFSDREGVQNWGFSWAERTLRSAFAQQAVELGLASTEELESISAGWRAWAEDPDAFFTFIHVEAVGRVD
jgi:ubiquinone/menaquinone biosynthesis C-methylase UbiE